MDDFQKYYDKALRFLSYRPRSEKEVRDNLRGKHAPLIIIDQIIEKLKVQNFINDEDFAKWWVEQRTTFRPKGIRLIKIELKQKGISPEIIENISEDPELSGASDLEKAKKLVEKRFSRYKGLPKEKIYEKFVRYLSSKGFDYDTIKEVIREVI